MSKPRSKKDRKVVSKFYRADDRSGNKAWGECESCGQHLPLVKETGMCGPCILGEADAAMTAFITILGDWG